MRRALGADFAGALLAAGRTFWPAHDDTCGGGAEAGDRFEGVYKRLATATQNAPEAALSQCQSAPGYLQKCCATQGYVQQPLSAERVAERGCRHTAELALVLLIRTQIVPIAAALGQGETLRRATHSLKGCEHA